MLKLVNINKRFDRFSLKSVDLEIGENEFFVILGPSGAGKTVLLEVIAGLLHPDDGDIVLQNHSVVKLPPEQRNIGLVYQDNALFPFLNAWENIAFGLRIAKLHKDSISHKVGEISDLLKIEGILDRSVHNLSGGEKQRIALARALVMEPKMVLLDEPLSSLDAPLRERLRKELKRIHSLTNTTFIHVTHDFEEAVFLADRIAVMREGKVVQVGSPDEIMRRPVDDFVAEFVGVKNIFQGNLSSDHNGLKRFENKYLKLQVSTHLDGACNISIPAEDILLSKEKLASSARNCLKGTVVEIMPRGRLKEVIVNVGEKIVALITERSLHEMELSEGAKVWVTFKTSAVHVF
ncbi:MAG: ABC transporter ATP-binding protein [Pseudomonadota bacterium]